MADAVAVESASDRIDKITGVILGTAVGDALGLPREGLSRQRARKLFGDPPLRHAFLFGRGMASDDTEHTCMTGQALLGAPDDVDGFARSLAWRLRFWLLGLPAGTGRATLRSVIKLWLGFPPTRSGVWSAGNGPAMRSVLLGVCLGHDRDRLRDHVRASTRLTHTDPRAERGAFLVALAAHFGAVRGPQGVVGETFLREAREALPDADDELRGLLDKVEDHLRPNSRAVDLKVIGRVPTSSRTETQPFCWQTRTSGPDRQRCSAPLRESAESHVCSQNWHRNHRKSASD